MTQMGCGAHDINNQQAKMEVRIELTKDSVCSMMVDEKSAKWTSMYGGKAYYFCSEGCKRTFDKDPKKYVK
jgi:YHS domain-containing protein